MSAGVTRLLIGRCLPCLKPNTSKFTVKKMVFDSNLMMYFDESDIVYAHDPLKHCKSGDYALIEELPVKLTKLVTHKVREIVFTCGDIIDPVTGKRVTRDKYRDVEEQIDSLYEPLPGRFDHKSAPPRGWQENKKDFSGIETYKKYHEDDDSPHAV